MARPQKFRLSPDDVLDPQNARKLAGHVAEIEFFRAEVEKLQTQIADIYDAADDDGFDKKFIRKVVARRAKDGTELQAEEYGIETYAMAVEKGLATRTREENPEHDADGVITEPATDSKRPADTGKADEPSSVEPVGEGSAPLLATNHPGGENANSVGNADASHASLRSGREEASRLAHNQEITGASPVPATNSTSMGRAADATGGGNAPVTTRTHNPQTHFLNSDGLLRLHGCEKPESCASSHPRTRLCFTCSTQHEGPAYQAGDEQRVLN